MQSPKTSDTEIMEQVLKDTGDSNLIEWSKVMNYIRTKVKYGEVTLIIHNGRIKQIEQIKSYYRPDNEG